jgi:uncharacterized protein (DUF58 family)
MARPERESQAVKKPLPTTRGWSLFVAAAVALVASAFFGRSDFLFVGLFLSIVPLAAMIMVRIDRPRLSVSRVFSPEAVGVGETMTLATTVRNQSPRPSPSATWRESASGGLALRGAALLPRLEERRFGARGGNDTVTLTQRVRATSRGAHEVGPLIVSRVDPFGLAYAEYALGQSRQFLVTPRVTRLTRGSLDVSQSEGIEHELLRHSIPAADELIAREYRSGDPLRRVHWRATARHDKLMVRQEEQRSNPEAWMFFDTRRAPGAEPQPHYDAHPDPEFEAAVELVASLGVHLLDEGFDVSVVESGPRQLTGRTGAGRTGTLGASTPTFDRAGAGRVLLADLASIVPTGPSEDDPVAELSAGLRRSGRAVPVFAILGESMREEVGALAAVRAMAEPAIAFVTPRADPDILEILSAAGWTCVTISVTGGPRLAWQQALERHRTVSQHG